MSGRNKTANICIVDLFDEELKIACDECHTILGKGIFGIGVIFNDRRYLVDHNPSVQCCKKIRSVPLLYDDEASARKMQGEIIKTVKLDQNFDHLILEDITDGLQLTTRH